MRIRIARLSLGIAILSIGTWLVSSVQGAGVDRDYTFGDDPLENAQNGMSVGSGSGADGTTFDSEGTFGDGSLVDLIANGFPVYDNSTTSRPLGGSGLGIRFDGVDDYLNNERLGLPDTSFSAAGGNNAGPLDYAGLANRGFQLWVNPSSAGSSNGFAQSIVADTNQHGVRISDSDTWVMRYAGTDVDSGVAVDFDDWSHVMVVRPFGTTGPTSGSRLYVDGVAIAGAGGGYTGADDTNLVVGASTGDMPGTADFFTGILDDLELFVLGTTTSDPPTEYGEFDFAVDNEFAADVLGSYVPGDTNGDGLVQGDGSGALGAADDVKTFVDNWRNEQLVTGVRAGDINSPATGDFNFDGLTDIEDWLLLRGNHTSPGSLNLGELLNGGSSVPEPSGIALLALASAGVLCVARRRQVAARLAAILAIGLGVGFVGQQAGAAVNSGGFLLDTGGDLTASALDVGATFDGSLFFDIDDPAEGSQFDSGTNGVDPGPFQDSQNPDVAIRQRNVLPSYVTFGAGADVNGVSGGWGYQIVIDDFDDPNFQVGGGVDMDFDDTLGFETGVIAGPGGGPAQGSPFELVGLTVGAGAPSQVLLGIYTDNLDGTAFVPTSFTVSNGSDIASLPMQPANLNGDVYFATVDVNEGDTISIAASGAPSLNTIGGILIGDATGFVEPPALNPTLIIDRETGSLTLENKTDSSLDIVTYEVLSANGALDPGSWDSIADSDSDWIEFTNSDERDNLAEAQQPDLGGLTLANDGGQISLGNAWLQSPTEDITMRLGLSDNSLITVDVLFTGNGGSPLVVGDFDGDGIDVDDWNYFKPLFDGDLTGLSPVEQYRAGDLNGDGAVTLADSRLFAASFDAANGPGSFLAAIGAVPEPASLTVVGVAMGGILLFRRRRSV